MDFNIIFGGLVAWMVFIGLSTPIIIVGVIYYLKKKLEHKQILAAIEKGTPLSELRPPKPPEPRGPIWIKYLTSGIAYLIIAAGLLWWLGYTTDHIWAPLILFAIGIAWVIRGLLYRKYQPSVEPSNKNGTAINRNS